MMAQSDAHVQLADDPSDLTQENDTGRSCPARSGRVSFWSFQDSSSVRFLLVWSDGYQRARDELSETGAVWEL